MSHRMGMWEELERVKASIGAGGWRRRGLCVSANSGQGQAGPAGQVGYGFRLIVAQFGLIWTKPGAYDVLQGRHRLQAQVN